MIKDTLPHIGCQLEEEDQLSAPLAYICICTGYSIKEEIGDVDGWLALPKQTFSRLGYYNESSPIGEKCLYYSGH